MRAIALAVILSATPTLAADPVGLWATARNDVGRYRKVRIAPCATDAATLCGMVENALDGWVMGGRICRRQDRTRAD